VKNIDLRVFEKRVLRELLGPRRESVSEYNLNGLRRKKELLTYNSWAG
jgi:hypothetical protein